MKKKNKVEEYCCSFSYCKRKFSTPLGLQWHEERDPLHNYRPQQIASINSSSTALIPLLVSSNSGKKIIVFLKEMYDRKILKHIKWSMKV